MKLPPSAEHHPCGDEVRGLFRSVHLVEPAPVTMARCDLQAGHEGPHRGPLLVGRKAGAPVTWRRA